MTTRQFTWTSSARARVLMAVVFAFVANSTLDAQVRARLTPQDIEQAIHFGATGNPEPYVLYLLLQGATGPPSPVVGALAYTPFLRVALQSRAAREEGRSLSVSDVDPFVLEPLVYIAFRWFWPYRQNGTRFDPFGPPEPRVFSIPAAGSEARTRSNFVSVRREERIRPIWTRHGAAALRAFGAEAPYDNVIVVASFPVDSLKADQAFMITRVDSPGVVGEGGAIYSNIIIVRPTDLAGWR